MLKRTVYISLLAIFVVIICLTFVANLAFPQRFPSGYYLETESYTTINPPWVRLFQGYPVLFLIGGILGIIFFGYFLQRYNRIYNKNPIIKYMNKAKLHGEEDEYYKAIVDCSKAIELDPNYANFYHMRGTLYDQVNNVPLAIADYKKYLSLSNYANDDEAFTKEYKYKEYKPDFQPLIEPLEGAGFFNQTQREWITKRISELEADKS
jgi:tetratricopeptide (TPR) repeat protein